MSAQQNPQTFDEIINNMRDNVLRTQSNASTVSINSFDNLVEQLQIFLQKINSQSAEIKQLQVLCRKNNIDYAIPPENIPPPKVVEKKIKS